MHYRLYHVRNGHFVRFDQIEAAGDIDALREAGTLVRELPAELWCGDRKIMTFDGREAG